MHKLCPRRHLLQVPLLLLIGFSSLLALPPNGTHVVVMEQPNVAVRFKDRVESLESASIFYDITVAGQAAFRGDTVMADSVPVYLHVATPNTGLPKDFRYLLTLRDLTLNRMVFGLVPSSAGNRAMARINCWMNPTHRYLLMVRCPPSKRVGIFKDWVPQLWTWFLASHGQTVDHSYPLLK